MVRSLFQWVKTMRREHGPIVSLFAAFVILLLLTLMLAVVFAIFGALMLVNPYLALLVGLAVVGVLIWKKV